MGFDTHAHTHIHTRTYTQARARAQGDTYVGQGVSLCDRVIGRGCSAHSVAAKLAALGAGNGRGFDGRVCVCVCECSKDTPQWAKEQFAVTQQ